MSRHRMEDIDCPKCKQSSDFMIWDSINTMLDPEMKNKVRTGEAFLFICPHCGHKTVVDYATLYHQMEDHVMIYYMPGDPTEAIEMMKGLYRTDKGELIRMDLELDNDYRNRVVRTMNQLKEKLIILDNGLDDKIIELSKLFMLASVQEKQPEINIQEFLFDIQKDGQWIFSVNMGNGEWGSINFPKDMYASVAEDFSPDLIETKMDVVVDVDWALHVLKRRKAIKKDNFGNAIKMWQPELDVLVLGEKPFLTGEDTADSGRFFHWAYSINTCKGLYRKSEEKTISVEEKIGNISMSFPQSLPIDLMLDDGKTCVAVMNNIAVWGTRYFDSFMIFSSNETNQTFLIDSRGIIFELPCDSNSDKYGNGGSVEIDKRKGCYLVNGVKVYYRTPNEQKVFAEASEPIIDALFNKAFNKFCRDNAHNETGYLYLIAGESKCGALVSFFAQNGMKYEIVPNIICDDDTVNVRIPLDEENATRKDVQFLCAKYSNAYAVYGIPFEDIGGGFDFPQKWKGKQRDLRFFMPKGKEALIYSIVDTLRIACEVDDDYEVYKKTFSKVTKLFERGSLRPEHNVFTDMLLVYPNQWEANDAYVLSKIDYINRLIEQSGYTPQKKKQEHLDFIARVKADGFDTSMLERAYANLDEEEQESRINPQGLLKEFDDAVQGRGKHYNATLFRVAYDEAKKQYKDAMARYESDMLLQMASQGIAINKWKNESNLFVTISKEYPDAVYQYHANWLGLQSLDIFVPSINMGFEYQGEQHYHPVEFFGGEAAYKEVVARDERKARLCKENGVTLIYWKYDEPISRAKLLKKIANAGKK